MRNRNKDILIKSRQIYYRYAVVGLLNTLITMSVYLLISSKFSYVVSYLTSYTVGIIINLYFQPKFVFQIKSNSFMRKRLLSANLIIIGVGVAINFFLDMTSLQPFNAASITALATIPIGFLLTRSSLLGKARSND
jgi:putative flippase GtrA